MNNKVLWGLGAVVVVVAGLLLYFQQSIDRASTISTLFTGEEQYENFNRMKDLFPHGTMTASSDPFDFPDGEVISLPSFFAYKGQTVDIETFLAETDTSAVLVLQNGQVRFERYMLTGGRQVNWLSMSVAKSFISAAIGIAIAEGHISSIEEPITNYVPSLAGSAYDGVRIKDILQMSSGARWNEDYNDPDSDINVFGRIFALGGSLNDFAATLERAREPGTYNLYNSTDTQVLGMLLASATDRTITDYMEEKIWHPLGMETNGYWLLDSEGMEMAFGGLNATARDYAKLGELYRNGGDWNGQQVVPAAWVAASVVADAPHLLAETKLAEGDPFPVGYGYQWWLPASDEGEFSAIGVYNQFIFVNPTRGIVIVKLSANSDYATSLDESAYREMETIEFFREIASVLE